MDQKDLISISYMTAKQFDLQDKVFALWLSEHIDITAEAIGHTRIMWKEDMLSLRIPTENWNRLYNRVD